MGQDTKIEWAKHTFNPWWGCTKVAAGCTHCYAEAFAKRTGKAQWGPGGTRVMTSSTNWKLPLRWNREAEKEGVRHRVFCASMADVFEDWQGRIVSSQKDEDGETGAVMWWRPDKGVVRAGETTVGHVLGERLATMDDARADLFKLIDATPHLDWLLLTKRPENIRRMWPSRGDFWRNFPEHANEHPNYRQNCWLLTSVAEQKDADANIPELLKCRELSPVLGLSCEPLVGPVDIRQWLTPEVHHHPDNDLSNPYVVTALSACARAVAKEYGMGLLDWVIIGGESGHGARECSMEWIRSIRDQCKAASVPVFVKQLGAMPIYQTIGSGSVSSGHIVLEDPKGGDMSEWPADLRVREFPHAT